MPFENVNLWKGNFISIPRKQLLILPSFLDQPVGITATLSLVNEAQYLLINTSSILELHQHLNTRYDVFHKTGRLGETRSPLGTRPDTYWGREDLRETVSPDLSFTDKKLRLRKSQHVVLTNSHSSFQEFSSVFYVTVLLL